MVSCEPIAPVAGAVNAELVYECLLLRLMRPEVKEPRAMRV
jgi:hypothetical protein